MLIENTLFGTVDKVKLAIRRIQINEPPEGYYVAFSGGKDSCVILDLVKKSGVKFDAHHNITNVEPPELIYFIHKNHREVEEIIPKITMWDLIIKNRMPPTRLARYCCKELKETGGEGRFVITGVRHEESIKRSKRKMLEPCYGHLNKQYLHPIIDWSEVDVWEYIRNENLSYCDLYDHKWDRIGCLFCPMSGPEKMKRDSDMYPQFKAQYIRTFEKMITERKRLGLKTNENWETGADVFDWWIGECDKDAYGQENLNFV